MYQGATLVHKMKNIKTQRTLKNDLAVLKWDMICSRYERGRLGFNLYMYTETFHPLSISTEQSVADKWC